MKAPQNQSPLYSIKEQCYNQSIDDSERSSFPVDDFDIPETKQMILKKKPQTKKVRFSEMSSMLCYEQRESEDSTALFYSKEDYEQMKAASYKAALAIRTIIESSSSFEAAQASNQNKSPIKRYTQAYNALPAILKTHSIEFTEVIGIEHLCIPQEMLKITLALRKNICATILDEQSRLMQSRRRQEEPSPQLLADSIKPIARVSRHLARERAWNVARSM